MKKQKTPGLTEAHVQQTVTEFLQLDGWRAIRTDPVSDRSRGKGFGELGMPDMLYLRYLRYPRSNTVGILWIEFKSPGESAKPHQLDWHEAERKRGALVMVVDDIDAFIAQYKSLPLCERF